MRVFYGFDNLPVIESPVVTIGSFDGVHRGHRLLIGQMNDLARERGGESVVITFDPHPRQLLKGENRLLSTLDEKLELLGETGVDNVIVVRFTLEFSRVSYQDFIEKYIVAQLHAQLLIVGQGHHFGHNRQGSVEALPQYGIQIMRLERYENISSTQIREAIDRGDMTGAVALLGSSGYLIHLPIEESSKLLPALGREYLLEMGGERMEVRLDRIFLRSCKKKIRILSEK